MVAIIIFSNQSRGKNTQTDHFLFLIRSFINVNIRMEPQFNIKRVRYLATQGNITTTGREDSDSDDDSNADSNEWVDDLEPFDPQDFVPEDEEDD